MKFTPRDFVCSFSSPMLPDEMQSWRDMRELLRVQNELTAPRSEDRLLRSSFVASLPVSPASLKPVWVLISRDLSHVGLGSGHGAGSQANAATTPAWWSDH